MIDCRAKVLEILGGRELERRVIEVLDEGHGAGERHKVVGALAREQRAMPVHAEVLDVREEARRVGLEDHVHEHRHEAVGAALAARLLRGRLLGSRRTPGGRHVALQHRVDHVAALQNGLHLLERRLEAREAQQPLLCLLERRLVSWQRYEALADLEMLQRHESEARYLVVQPSVALHHGVDLVRRLEGLGVHEPCHVALEAVVERDRRDGRQVGRKRRVIADHHSRRVDDLVDLSALLQSQ